MTTQFSAVRSLPGNLAAFVLPTLLLNGIIFGLGWDAHTAPSPYLPPGWLVGTIWLLLFTAMGTARWLLLRADGKRSGLVVLLALLCLIYPLYTVGLRSESIGLAGCIVTAAVAIWVAVRVLRESRAAAGLTALVVAWLLFATVALARTMHAQGSL